MASIIALQTAALEEVHGAFRSLPESSRDAVLERVREGRLQVRVVEGHVSHAKIFLLSDGPRGDRCVLTGSAYRALAEAPVRWPREDALAAFEGELHAVREHIARLAGEVSATPPGLVYALPGRPGCESTPDPASGRCRPGQGARSARALRGPAPVDSPHRADPWPPEGPSPRALRSRSMRAPRPHACQSHKPVSQPRTNRR